MERDIPVGEWRCDCGELCSGKFCPECGRPCPAAESNAGDGEWRCDCGNANTGNFCTECGRARAKKTSTTQELESILASGSPWRSLMPYGEYEAILHISRDSITLKTQFKQLSDGCDVTTEPGLLLLRSRENLLPFDWLALHLERCGDIELPVLSLVVFEHDGRGPVVFDELVREEELSLFPKGYRSSYYLKLNGCPVIPSVNTTIYTPKK